LAAVSGESTAIKKRDLIASKMPAKQLLQAKRWVKDCLASNLKDCDL
jgi:hypothetical protein